jgi:phosphoglycolate phosphatase
MMKKPRAVLFDWDNTLVNTGAAMDIAVATMFDKMNVDLSSFDRSDPNNFLSAKDALPLIFGSRWQEASQIYREAYKKHQFDNINLLKGSKEVLDLLRKNDIYVAVVSNKLGQTLREEVSHFKLNDYFSKIIGSLDAKEDKPSKEPVLAALADSNIAPSQDVWFVGDSEIDMLCAINSKCKAVFLGKTITNKFEHVEIVENHNVFLKLLNKFIKI